MEPDIYVIMIHIASDNYSLLWLENAMTLPIGNNDQHYYFDGRSNNLFALVNIDENDTMAYVDRFYQELDADTANELAQRLAYKESKLSKVIEIPRLTIAEKINLQLAFIARLQGSYNYSTLITAVKQQPNDSSFVLDYVIEDTHNAAVITKNWDEYKLETISNYIDQFIDRSNNRPSLAVA